MNNEAQNQTEDVREVKTSCCSRAESIPEKPDGRLPGGLSRNRFDLWLVAGAFIAGIILGGATIYAFPFRLIDRSAQKSVAPISSDLEKAVLPAQGIFLSVVWNDMGKRLVESGAVDQKKFEALYAQRGGLDGTTKKLLTGSDNGRLVITKNNANALLNLLWALGLANKNSILENGMMTSKQFGGDPGKFASTGGWTLAVGKTMDHYSNHALISLTPDQQALVEKTSKNIYRPCCGNSTYFPDCNHGMAMLGLLELMASQGVNEQDMYRAALAVNSYWFPDNYITLAQYEKSKGISWDKVDPQQILGPDFSSASGYQKILAQVKSAGNGTGPSCGV